MRLWNLSSASDSGCPRRASSPRKTATASREWKEKRLAKGRRSLVALTGREGVWVTTYRYTGLSSAAATFQSDLEKVQLYQKQQPFVDGWRRLPAAFSASSLLGHVTLMSDTMVVKARSGHRSLVGQRAESGYNFNASFGRSSEKDCSFSACSINQPISPRKQSISRSSINQSLNHVIARIVH